jgi:malic enzyme
MTRLKTIAIVSAGAIAAASGIAALSSNAGASETINYTYDAKGRLILTQHSGSVNNNVVANYTFDNADNRKNLKVTGAP